MPFSRWRQARRYGRVGTFIVPDLLHVGHGTVPLPPQLLQLIRRWGLLLQ